MRLTTFIYTSWRINHMLNLMRKFVMWFDITRVWYDERWKHLIISIIVWVNDTQGTFNYFFLQVLSEKYLQDLVSWVWYRNKFHDKPSYSIFTYIFMYEELMSLKLFFSYPSCYSWFQDNCITFLAIAENNYYYLFFFRRNCSSIQLFDR